MAQHKSGLHKRISFIFDGVPVTKQGDGQQGAAAPGQDYRGHLPPRTAPAPPAARPYTVHTPPKVQPESTARPDFFTTIQWQGAVEYIKEKLLAVKWEQFADKQKIRILLVPALAIILIFVLYINFAGGNRQASSTDVKDIFASAEGQTAGSVAGWRKPEPYPMFLRDPTQFSAVAGYAAGAGSVAVRGIVYSNDRPSAVIGNEIIHEGDNVYGVKVVKINKDSVEFSSEGKSWTQKVQ